MKVLLALVVLLLSCIPLYAGEVEEGIGKPESTPSPKMSQWRLLRRKKEFIDNHPSFK